MTYFKEEKAGTFWPEGIFQSRPSALLLNLKRGKWGTP
jgi:hypothetical protein